MGIKVTIDKKFTGNPALVIAGKILPNKLEQWLIYSPVLPRHNHQWRNSVRTFLDRFRRYEPVEPYTIDIG